MTKTAENPTLSVRTYLYSPYEGVSSPSDLTRAYNKRPHSESDIEDIDFEEVISKTD